MDWNLIVNAIATTTAVFSAIFALVKSRGARRSAERANALADEANALIERQARAVEIQIRGARRSAKKANALADEANALIERQANALEIQLGAMPGTQAHWIAQEVGPRRWRVRNVGSGTAFEAKATPERDDIDIEFHFQQPGTEPKDVAPGGDIIIDGLRDVGALIVTWEKDGEAHESRVPFESAKHVKTREKREAKAEAEAEKRRQAEWEAKLNKEWEIRGT